MLHYKGYTGIAEVDPEAGVIFGRVIGLRDVITFQAESAADVQKEFETSVDSYVEFCASRGEAPEKPFSGKFLVRIEPALHRALAVDAEARGMSLNALVERLLSEAAEHRAGTRTVAKKTRASGKAKTR